MGVRKALRAIVRPVGEIATAIEEQDAAMLSTLPGIGAATAERMIAKLRRRMPKFALLVAREAPDQAGPADVLAETFDVLVTPERDEAYTIFAQSMDRTGFARGTLAPREGMAAVVPGLDQRVALTMADMGQDMSHAGHDMADMPGMDMSGTVAVTHAPTETGPGVDMLAMNPTTRLNDPGVGLRDNGRRVLTYADLRSTFPDPDGREPTATIELHLTGHMERYIWSFNGVKSSDAGPIRLRYGDRVRFVLVNDSMMTHPIHLHGLWSDLEDEQGNFQVRKHTISVKPGERVTYRVSADALGRWAYHCHLMMHMETGMFREVIVDE